MARSDFPFGLGGLCLIGVGLCGLIHLTLSDSVICGNAINNALTLMCGDKGFNTYRNKRNFPSEDNFDIEDENFELDLNQFPFWSSMSANSLAKLRRRRDGVYYECCLKPCTKQELMTFCRS